MLTERSINQRSSRRPVGLPQLGESCELPEDAATARHSLETPYRLPKMQEKAASRHHRSVTRGDVVYTRYGLFTPCNERSSSPDPEDNDRQPLPPRTSRSVFPGPAFTQAVVTPVWSPLMSQQYRRSDTGVQNEAGELSKRFQSQRSKTSCTVAFSAFGSTIPRGPSLAGGWDAGQHAQLPSQEPDAQGSFGTEEKPVHWVMKPLRRFQVDRKGQQRNQGPFSRELVVHARPPQSWLRMKWGAISSRLPAG